MNRKPYIAYLDYYATGEGRTILIAVGSTAKQANAIYDNNVHEYFKGNATVVHFNKAPEHIAKFVPEIALNVFEKNPPGITDFFTTLHFNLS